MPLQVLGHPAYPGLPWLMKPYPDHTAMSRRMENYNYGQSRACIVVGNAFSYLRGRWKCLLRRLYCDLSDVGNVVVSCVCYTTCASFFMVNAFLKELKALYLQFTVVITKTSILLYSRVVNDKVT